MLLLYPTSQHHTIAMPTLTLCKNPTLMHLDIHLFVPSTVYSRDVFAVTAARIHEWLCANQEVLRHPFVSPVCLYSCVLSRQIQIQTERTKYLLPVFRSLTVHMDPLQHAVGLHLCGFPALLTQLLACSML